MKEQPTSVIGKIQRAIAKCVAMSPAGHNLLLIGGFRYRFLDQSSRTSRDVDYHWSGDLEAKRTELVRLFQSRLVPNVRRQWGYEGSVEPADPPGSASPAVSTVNLSFWKTGVALSRIEIPVEITRVERLDPTEVRTVDGVIYPTLSDADAIEGKMIAVFRRGVVAHRDLLDVFLFANRLRPDSPERLRRKLNSLSVSREEIDKRLDDFRLHALYHARAIQAVIDSQLDVEAGENLRVAGGAAMVLEKVIEILRAHSVEGVGQA